MKKRVSPSISHLATLRRRLRSPEYAAGYLTACLQDGEETFLLGLRHVAEAQGGLRSLARKTRLNREHLFRMLSESGNPEFHSVREIVGSLGFKWAVRPG